MDTNPREFPGLIQVQVCMTDYEADRDLEETKAKSQNDPMAKEKSSTPRASRCSENASREHQLCVKWEEPRAMLGALVLVPTQIDS